MLILIIPNANSDFIFFECINFRSETIDAHMESVLFQVAALKKPL